MDVDAPIALIGAGYLDRDSAVDDFTSVWSTRHDGDFHHTAVAVLTRDPAGELHVERHNNTAKHLEWGGALLGSALVVLAPAAGVRLLAGVGWSGAGAMIATSASTPTRRSWPGSAACCAGAAPPSSSWSSTAQPGT